MSENKTTKKTQKSICLNCEHSCTDADGGICDKHDLCFEFGANGTVILPKDDSTISCDGGDWE